MMTRSANEARRIVGKVDSPVGAKGGLPALLLECLPSNERTFSPSLPRSTPLWVFFVKSARSRRLNRCGFGGILAS